jgi:mono/diheme cytochrome c family protein
MRVRHDLSVYGLGAIAAAASLAAAAALSASLSARADDAPTARGQVTFTKEIAPIFQRSCGNCHRPDSIAPMSLMTYAEARPWVRSIKQKVSQREMPPWFIDRRIGIQKFKEDPSLTDEEIGLIVKWVDSGALQGNPADMPSPLPPVDNLKWEIGTPDLIVWSPQYTVPAAGSDEWRDLFSDTSLTEDRYIKAIQIKTDSVAAYKVVHHAHQYMVSPELAENASWTMSNGDISLNEYSIGKKADIFVEGSGRLIKAGGKIRFNVHMHPSGEETRLRVGVGLVFYPKGVIPKHAVVTDAMGGSQNLDIPAGEVVRTDGYTPFKTPVKITGFQPHMHYRGKGGCIEALYPTGQTEILNCAGFNLGWGIMYNYADDVAPILPAGSFLHVINWHDNTASNRGNPDYKNWTGSGDRTVDEMSHSWVSWYPMTEEEYQQEVAERRAARPKTMTVTSSK